MKRLALFALVGGLALAGCKGCNDDTSGNNENNTNNMTEPDASPPDNDAGNNLPEGCVDADGDGFPVGLTCDGRVDCNDDSPSSNPDAAEVCFDGLDNNCDGTIDEDCPECEEGTTESCGTDEGRCTAGTRTCTGGEWSDCDGEEGPFTEECNGEDDDCDGEIDENPDLLCDNGITCDGVELCEAGSCTTGAAIECGHLDGPCMTGMCSEKDRGCRAFPRENGETCDDGLFCTENGTCDMGECKSTPRDCSSATDQCNTGVCDETTDACIPQPISDGTMCDDGMFCTIADSCQGGVCAGGARDCSAQADQCNAGMCDDSVDSCVKAPLANDTACDDGLYCTMNDTCQAGACTSGPPRQCGASGGSCRQGTCDEASDSCTGDPVADGTPCDDGAFCTIGDRCVAGTCTPTAPQDCSSANGLCRVGTCDEAINQCVASPAADGTMCDDGQFCTTGDVCAGGACSGAQRDCAAAGDTCTTGVCNEATDSCSGTPKSDGTSCDDSLFCTVGDVCVAGVCENMPRDCSNAGDDCNDGVCNESMDSCNPAPKVDGTMCNDGQFCTENDTCQGGFCIGGERDCTALDTECSFGTCDEMGRTCTATALTDGAMCDDGDWCTVNEVCISGLCSGTNRDCASANDQCNIGVCNSTNMSCGKSPASEGAGCDDGLFCNTGETCQNGACVGGGPRDCAASGDQCRDGECDENADSCGGVAKPNGTPCNDGVFCTAVDACQAGNCVGTGTTDCSSATMGDMCLDGVCDTMTDSCETVDNGSCDPCAAGRPTANAGPDQTNVVPNQTIALNGTGSSDPTGQALSYSWRVDMRPAGSTSSPTNPSASSTTFLADLAGTYTICLQVTDTDGCVSADDCMQIVVTPLADLHIELTWDKDRSDVDLHYLAGTNRDWWFDAKANNGSSATCSRGGPKAADGPDNFWCVLNPDWGGNPISAKDNNGANDPSLDVDNVIGFGPENINQSNLPDGQYTVGVHYFADNVTSSDPAAGGAPARVRIYVNGALQRECTRTITCRQFWEAARITVSGGGTSVTSSCLSSTFDVVDDDVLNVILSDGTVTDVDQAPRGLCRCQADNDCWGTETCENTSRGLLCLP